jgi:hypothetical protein
MLLRLEWTISTVPLTTGAPRCPPIFRATDSGLRLLTVGQQVRIQRLLGFWTSHAWQQK